ERGDRRDDPEASQARVAHERGPRRVRAEVLKRCVDDAGSVAIALRTPTGRDLLDEAVELVPPHAAGKPLQYGVLLAFLRGVRWPGRRLLLGELDVGTRSDD